MCIHLFSKLNIFYLIIDVRLLCRDIVFKYRLYLDMTKFPYVLGFVVTKFDCECRFPINSVSSTGDTVNGQTSIDGVYCKNLM